MKVYNTRTVSHQSFANQDSPLIFDQTFVHFFQSNQRFRAIEFVDQPVPEKS